MFVQILWTSYRASLRAPVVERYRPCRWVSRCILRLPSTVKLLLHCPQLYGFTPLWKRSCLRQLSCLENILPQILQLYGLSPVCTRWCVFSRVFWVKDFPHSRHLKGLKGSWLALCSSSWDKRGKPLLQTEHMNSFWFALHTFNSLFALKLFLLRMWSSVFDPNIPAVDLCTWGGATDGPACREVDCKHWSWLTAGCETCLNCSLWTDSEVVLPMHKGRISTSTFIGTLKESSAICSTAVDKELYEFSVFLWAAYCSGWEEKICICCCIACTASTVLFSNMLHAGGGQIGSSRSPASKQASLAADAMLSAVSWVASSSAGSHFTTGLMSLLSSAPCWGSQRE